MHRIHVSLLLELNFVGYFIKVIIVSTYYITLACCCRLHYHQILKQQYSADCIKCTNQT